MTKEKQKMTLNVRRRANTDAAAAVAPPPAADPAKIAAFAGAIEAPTAPNQTAAATNQIFAATEPAIQVIRDAFTMPAEDHRLFAEIQQKCLAQGISITKSEIVRAGLKYIAGLPATDLAAIVKTVPKLKIGRPADKYKKSK